MAFSPDVSTGGLRGGGAGLVRTGVTGSGGVVVATGLGGAGTFSSGGVAVVSGAIVVNGFESAGAGAGAAATGAAAFTFFSEHPMVARARPHRHNKVRDRFVISGLGYPFCSANGWPKSRTFPAGASRERANGNSSRKVVPRPTSESNSIRPLCNCTNRKVLASPMPVPPGRVVKKS